MVNQIRRPTPLFPRMDSVTRIGGIPIVESGIKSVETIYNRVKSSNKLFIWSFETVESSMFAAIETARPLINLMEGPLGKIDGFVCKSLDMIEQRVPSMYLPPQLMYWNTKEYMSDHLVRPVLTRANSVKKARDILLDSKMTNFAANRLDDAFDVADKYIEKYLPDSEDNNTIYKDDIDAVEDKQEPHAVQTYHKGQHVTRKLGRRLTQRTIAEAIALKNQSTQAINILVYAAELIVTDPKLALKKGRELWHYLSQDEPENQAGPQHLEELVVMLTRETARRMVHFINFTVKHVTRLPRTIRRSVHELVIHFLYATDSLIKVTHLENAKGLLIKEAEVVCNKLSNFYKDIENYVSNSLENFAIFLSGRLEAEKITATNRRRIYATNNDHTVRNNLNSIY